ncbi:MAG: four helix bundle protein [Planctomycetota bacterium]|jgi:four helix bundle protein
MELNYIDQDQYDTASNELTEIRKMISGYIKTVRKANS